MKKILCLLFAVVSFFSCQSTYYYSVLGSKDPKMEKVENGDFLLQTDSLWIAYCFKGESAPIQITVFNKTDKPLYLDWSKSALIVNNVAVSYVGQNISFGGISDNTANSYGYQYGRNNKFNNTYSSTHGEFSGTAQLPKTVSFIPPRSMISEKTLNLQIGFDNIDKKDYKNQKMSDRKNNLYDVERATFSKDQTPLKFTSYLTIYDEEQNHMVFEQEFYISDLLKTNGLSPDKLPDIFADRGDWFYIEKPANNSFVNVLLGTTIIAGAAILDTALDSGGYN